MSLTRRTFLQISGMALGAAATGCRFPSAGTHSPSPCESNSWTKHGVILQATEPWEGKSIQNFTTRAEPISAREWRIWYSVSDEKMGYQIAFAEGVQGERMRKTVGVCSPGEPANALLAIGNLPSNWKPVQPTHLQLPNGKHRLYFWAHGPQVCRYLVAESDDGRRYKIINPLRPVLYHPNDRASFGVPSPDGVMYRHELAKGRPSDEPLAESRLISNDATTIYELPNGTFEMYSVALVNVPKTDPAYIAEDNAPGRIRVVDRYTSENGIHFTTRERVMQRDASDPADQQFYYLSVTHTPRGRVGMLGHYRCTAQTMDLEWCFSKDGVQWARPRREGWLRRGNPPDPDCFGIYAGSHLVFHANKWHLFYTGVNHSHNGKKTYGPAGQVIMHATTPSIWST